MCMWDDAGTWELSRTEWRKAAKEHRCGECRRTIAKGERYEYTTGLYDGHWDTEHTCEQCHQVTRWLVVACSGYLYQAVQEDLFEHITGEEAYLRTAPLTRLGRWMASDWRDRNGDLRPVEAVREVADRAIAAYRVQYAKAVS